MLNKRRRRVDETPGILRVVDKQSCLMKTQASFPTLVLESGHQIVAVILVDCSPLEPITLGPNLNCDFDVVCIIKLKKKQRKTGIFEHAAHAKHFHKGYSKQRRQAKVRGPSEASQTDNRKRPN